MTPPKAALLLVKELLIILNEESPNVVMTPPPMICKIIGEGSTTNKEIVVVCHHHPPTQCYIVNESVIVYIDCGFRRDHHTTKVTCVVAVSASSKVESTAVGYQCSSYICSIVHELAAND